MPANFVIGNQTQILFGLLPASIAILDIPYAPPNSKYTLSALAAINATTLSLVALTDPVAAGTPLRFGTGQELTLSAIAAKGATSISVSAAAAEIPAGANLFFDFGGVLIASSVLAAVSATTVLLSKPLPKAFPIGSKVFVYNSALVTVVTTADAIPGDTSILIQPSPAAIATASVAQHQGIIALVGGTTSSEQITASDTEAVIYGQGITYSTGAVTKASWKIDYTTNVLPSDIAYRRLKYAAVNAIGGVLGWVRKVDPAPVGTTVGEIIEGTCAVISLNKTNPSDGIIVASTSFTGRGSPFIIDAV